MPYVPPHLRGAGAGGDAGPAPDGPSTSSRGPERPPGDSFGRQRSESWGQRDNFSPRGDKGGSMSRTNSYGQFGDSRPATGMSRSGSRPNIGASIETVWPEWTPSDRVKQLGEEQVKEIRSRLKVSVEVPEGQKPAAPPIEAFSEMVRLSPLYSEKQLLHLRQAKLRMVFALENTRRIGQSCKSQPSS